MIIYFYATLFIFIFVFLIKRHYGVLLLYGQHLALNHLVGQNQIRMVIGNNLLDQSTTDANPSYVQQNIRLNFHCWHTNDRFSKFAFKLSKFARATQRKLDSLETNTKI